MIEKSKLQRESLLNSLKDSFKTDFGDLDEGEIREKEREMKKEHEKEVYTRIDAPLEHLIDINREKITLTWIVYMRLTRRSQSIRAARVLFGKARKSSVVTSYIFVASGFICLT